MLYFLKQMRWGSDLQIIILKEGTSEGVPWRENSAVPSDTVNWFPKNHRVKAQIFLTLVQVSEIAVQRPLSTERKHNC